MTTEEVMKEKFYRELFMTIGMLFNMPVLLWNAMYDQGLFIVNIFACINFFIFLSFLVYGRRHNWDIPFYDGRDPISVMWSITLLTYVFGMYLSMEFVFRNRMNIRWYEKRVTRGYWIPTKAKREEHFYKRLSGELSE